MRLLKGDLLGSGLYLYIVFSIIYIPFFIRIIIKKKNIFYHILFFIFYIYIYKLFELLFLPIPTSAWGIQSFRDGRSPNIAYFNIIPFHSIGIYFLQLIKGPAYNWAIRQLMGNILALVPLGFFLPLLYTASTKLKKFVIFAIGIPFLFESIQLTVSISIHALYRFADIDDVITNAIGMIIGFEISKLFVWIMKKSMKVDISKLLEEQISIHKSTTM